MAKIESALLATSIDKILAFSKGEEVDGERGGRAAATVAAWRRRPTFPHHPPPHNPPGVKGKVRKFTETIELQVSLRNYDPAKDKRFTGAFRLPIAPRPTLAVCVLGSEIHCSAARSMSVDAMVRVNGGAGGVAMGAGAGAGGGGADAGGAPRQAASALGAW